MCVNLYPASIVIGLNLFNKINANLSNKIYRYTYSYTIY